MVLRAIKGQLQLTCLYRVNRIVSSCSENRMVTGRGVDQVLPQMHPQGSTGLLCGLSSALLITQSGSIRTLSTGKGGALEIMNHSSLFFWEQSSYQHLQSMGFNKRNDLHDIGQANFPDSKVIHARQLVPALSRAILKTWLLEFPECHAHNTWDTDT